PDEAVMLARAEVEAAHEATHTFNHSLREPDRYADPSAAPWTCDPWKWFDEAMAVFMERQVFRDNLENLRYALHWAYLPELLLEWPQSPGGYCAAWFIEYLVNTFGWEFLYKVWHDRNETEKSERPVNVIDRLLRTDHHGLRFEDMFAGEGRAITAE